MSDAPEGPEVLYDVEAGVATITLNRPHRRNAISVRMLLELGEILTRVDRDRGVRVAILTGRARASAPVSTSRTRSRAPASAAAARSAGAAARDRRSPAPPTCRP
jgi:enoyl-CoA hydratase/carnithine racemase